MNFYELFEASKEKEEQSKKAGEYQDVTIADPKAAIALKQARAKYTYADSDLEAFVKMTQDKEDEEDAEIEKLEIDTERQEDEIKDLEDKQNKDAAEINKLEKEIELNQKEIIKLKQVESDYEDFLTNKMPAYYKKIAEIDQSLQELEERLKKVQGYNPGAVKRTVILPDPSTFSVKTDEH